MIVETVPCDWTSHCIREAVGLRELSDGSGLLPICAECVKRSGVALSVLERDRLEDYKRFGFVPEGSPS
jgi:hypothetical protein